MISGRGEYLLMVDADGATKFSDLQKLEAKMKNLHKEPVIDYLWCCNQFHGDAERFSVYALSFLYKFPILTNHFNQKNASA